MVVRRTELASCRWRLVVRERALTTALVLSAEAGMAMVFRTLGCLQHYQVYQSSHEALRGTQRLSNSTKHSQNSTTTTTALHHPPFSPRQNWRAPKWRRGPSRRRRHFQKRRPSLSVQRQSSPADCLPHHRSFLIATLTALRRRRRCYCCCCCWCASWCRHVVRLPMEE